MRSSIRSSPITHYSLLFLLALPASAQTIIYVNDDATGADNGTSWSNAYRFLQDALADAATNGMPTEVWVAAGTYRPDESTANPTGTGDRTASFQLINNVALYGGFAGTELTLSERAGLYQQTVLSRSLGGGFPSYNIIRSTGVSSNTLLDGFSVSGGNATVEPAPYNGGGGMRNSGSKPTVRNCVFANNRGRQGGGIYNDASSPLIVNSTFMDNHAGGDGGPVQGGGIYFQYAHPDGSTPRIENCLLNDNSAGQPIGAGAGICAIDTSLTIVDCAFYFNISAIKGGAIHCQLASSQTLSITGCSFADPQPDVFANYVESGEGGACYIAGSGDGIVVSDCIFNRNIASAGSPNGNGGAIFLGTSTPTLVTRCAFTSNSATRGAGVYTVSNAQLTLERCTFTQNNALRGGFVGGDPRGGGALYGSSVKVVNCEFYGNRADRQGGGGSGIVFGGAIRGTDITVVNSLFSGNAVFGGGGAACYLVGAPSTLTNTVFAANSGAGALFAGGATISNCILWANSPSSQIGGTPSPTVRYTCIQGSAAGPGNIATVPLFVRVPDDGGDGWGDNPQTIPIEGANDDFGDLRVMSNSPCVDAGDNSAIGPDFADLDGDGNYVEPSPYDLALRSRRSDRPLTVDTGAGVAPIVDMGPFEWSDCNLNGIDDGEDISSGVSQDANGDGTPDECSFWASDVGLWNNPVNWDPPEVPDNDPQVGRVFVPTIDAVTAQVTLDIDAEIDGLAVIDGAALEVSAGDLSIATSAGILNGGNITVTGNHSILADTGPILVRPGGTGCRGAERGCSPPVLRMTAMSDLVGASLSVTGGLVDRRLIDGQHYRRRHARFRRTIASRWNRRFGSR